MAELLGVDNERYAQVGMFPVAYTIGTDFKPAPRLDLAELDPLEPLVAGLPA